MDKLIKSKTYTIRGIAILAIILCHAPITISKYCQADLAVSVFFFFTGYFIMNNYLIKDSYFNRSYLIRKFYKIYIAFVISNIVYILSYIVLYDKNCFNNILDLFLKILGIIPVNGYLWFIPHIFIFYIVCYLFYHKKKNTDIRYFILVYLFYLLIVIGVFSILKIWGGYLPVEHLLLAVGGVYALINYKKPNKELWNKEYRFAFCIAFILLFIYKFYNDCLIITYILQIITPFFLLIVIKYNKILDLIGKNSLLLYLYHIPIISILNYFIINKNELVYMVIYLIFIFLMIIVWKIIENIFNKKIKLILSSY